MSRESIVLNRLEVHDRADYIYNPATRRAVKRTSMIGKAVEAMARHLRANPETRLAAMFAEKCADGGTWDPSTNHCVTSEIDGRQRALRALALNWNTRSTSASAPNVPPPAAPGDGFAAAEDIAAVHELRQQVLANRAKLQSDRAALNAERRLFEDYKAEFLNDLEELEHHRERARRPSAPAGSNAAMNTGTERTVTMSPVSVGGGRPGRRRSREASVTNDNRRVRPRL